MGIPGMSETGVNTLALPTEHGRRSWFRTLQQNISDWHIRQSTIMDLRLVSRSWKTVVDSVLGWTERPIFSLHFPFRTYMDIHSLSNITANILKARHIALHMKNHAFASPEIQFILLILHTPHGPEHIWNIAESFNLEMQMPVFDPRRGNDIFKPFVRQFGDFDLRMPNLTSLRLMTSVNLLWPLFRALPRLRFLECFPIPLDMFPSLQKFHDKSLILPELSTMVLHCTGFSGLQTDELLLFLSTSHLPKLLAFSMKASPDKDQLRVSTTALGFFFDKFLALEYLTLPTSLWLVEDQHQDHNWLNIMDKHIHQLPNIERFAKIHSIPVPQVLQYFCSSPVAVQWIGAPPILQTLDLVLRFAQQDKESISDELLTFADVIKRHLQSKKTAGVSKINIASIENHNFEPLGLSGVVALLDAWEPENNRHFQRAKYLLDAIKFAVERNDVTITHYEDRLLDKVMLYHRLKARIDLWHNQRFHFNEPDDTDLSILPNAAPALTNLDLLHYNYDGPTGTRVIRPYKFPAMAWINLPPFKSVTGRLDKEGVSSQLVLAQNGTVFRVYKHMHDLGEVEHSDATDFE